MNLNKVKLLVRFFLVFLCLQQLHACSDVNRESIAFGLDAAPVTLDPRFATDAVSYHVCRLLYQRMVDFDENSQAIPALTSWAQLASNHYRFQLIGSNHYFHDGNRLTATDIKATYKSVLDTETVSPHRGSVEMIEQIQVLDENTLDFILSQPDPLFPGRLVIGIIPEALINSAHAFNKNPVGSGPMKFLDWQDESKLILQRLKDKQTIEFITLKDPTVRVLKLLRGEIDLLQGNIPPEMVNWLDKNDEVQVSWARGNTFSYLGFNMEDPQTGNHLIREAIAHAIDREKIIRFVMADAARPAGAIFPPDHWVGDETITGYSYNPARSRELLSKAGYDQSESLHLVYKTSNNPFRLRLATIIQNQLKEIGIETEIRSYDWGTFYADIKGGRFQMYSLSWVGLKMPDVFRYVFHSSAIPPNGANRGRFINQQVDSLIETAEIEMSLGKQAEYYRRLQQILLDAIPYVPLWYEDNFLVSRNNIQGYQLSVDGNFDGLNTITKTLN